MQGLKALHIVNEHIHLNEEGVANESSCHTFCISTEANACRKCLYTTALKLICQAHTNYHLVVVVYDLILHFGIYVYLICKLILNAGTDIDCQLFLRSLDSLMVLTVRVQRSSLCNPIPREDKPLSSGQCRTGNGGSH